MTQLFFSSQLFLQEEYAKLLRGQQSSAVNESSGTNAKEVKNEVEWQQHEQKLFEAALQKYPKGTEERLPFCLLVITFFQVGADSRISSRQNKRTVHRSIQGTSRTHQKEKNCNIIDGHHHLPKGALSGFIAFLIQFLVFMKHVVQESMLLFFSLVSCPDVRVLNEL